jgi:hypothetical protein
MSWEDILKEPPVNRDEAYNRMRGKIGQKMRPQVAKLSKKVDEMIRHATQMGHMNFWVKYMGDEHQGPTKNKIGIYYGDGDGIVRAIFYDTSDREYRFEEATRIIDNLYRIWKKESDAEVTLTKDPLMINIKMADDVEYDKSIETNIVDKPKRWWGK